MFDRNRAAWAALVMVTLVSVALAEWSHGLIATAFAVFGAAILKGQIVAVRFMETPKALPSWDSLYRIWIVAIGLVLCGGVILAGQPH